MHISAWQLALLLSVLCTISGGLLLRVAQRDAWVQRRLHYVRGRLERAAELDESVLWMRILGTIGGVVLRSGLLSRSAINDLEQTLNASGSRATGAVALFVGAKIVTMTGLPFLVWGVIALTELHIPVGLAMAFAATIGLLAPDMIVRNLRKKYLKAVEVGMPAALDLLIICAEAGLSLEGGLERVSVEGKGANKSTANEFRLTANEMKILADRRQALVNMGTRTNLDSMTRLGSSLAQSLRYGTPLTQALRVLAAELRTAALTRFEERAARIPVLLTIPMILFILPCIFVVVGGPAAVQVVQTFMRK